MQDNLHWVDTEEVTVDWTLNAILDVDALN